MRIDSERVLHAAAAMFAAGLVAPLLPFVPTPVAPLLMLGSLGLAECAVRMDSRRT